jgi:hypothetical protein
LARSFVSFRYLNLLLSKTNSNLNSETVIKVVRKIREGRILFHNSHDFMIVRDKRQGLISSQLSTNPDSEDPWRV